MNIYHNSYAQTIINKDHKKASKKNERAVENNSNRILVLEKSIEELSLMTESLWQLLKQESNLSETDLADKIKYTFDKNEEESKLKQECGHCSQKIPLKEKRCYYCGEPL